MFKTRFTETFGVEYPTSAVSNASGLGMLATAGIPSGDELRQAIHKTRSLTDKPFAVNLPFTPGTRTVSDDAEGGSREL